MKRILLTSLTIIMISAAIFLPVYALLFFTVSTKAKDYKADIMGSWEVFQYYKGSDRVACDDEIHMELNIAENRLSITGTVLPEVSESYKWNSGTSLHYETAGKENMLFFSFDSQGNLKITVGDGEYILLLRRQAGG